MTSITTKDGTRIYDKREDWGQSFVMGLFQERLLRNTILKD
jgi:hypothetical protein